MYLLLLGAILVLIGRLLFFLAKCFVIAERIPDYIHVRLPVVGPALAAFTFCCAENLLKDIYTLSEDVFWSRGAHSLKFGMLINRYRLFKDSRTARGSYGG